MSFLTNLTKGFVRSAVNQVGRDGGRVISNRVYGGNHSIPLHEPATELPISGSNFTNTVGNRVDLVNSGYKSELFETGIINNFFIVLGSFIIPIAGSIYWLLITKRNISKKTTRFFILRQEPVYVRDRRYKTGVRQEGYKNVKKYSNINIESTKNERLVYISKGIIAFILASYIFYFQYSIYKSWNENPSGKSKTTQQSKAGED